MEQTKTITPVWGAIPAVSDFVAGNLYIDEDAKLAAGLSPSGSGEVLVFPFNLPNPFPCWTYIKDNDNKVTLYFSFPVGEGESSRIYRFIEKNEVL